MNIENRVASGVRALDEMIAGGLIENRTFLVSGQPGTGKTIFALQFIAQALKEGSKCAYVASSETPDSLLSNARSLGWDFDEAIDDKRFILLDISPYVANMFNPARKHIKDPGILVADMARYIKRFHADRLVIDPVNPLLSSTPNLPEDAYCREFVFALEDHLDCTTLLTLNSTSRAIEPIEHYVSGVIGLDVAWRGPSFQRVLTVKKMRATPVGVVSCNFTIAAENGIELIDFPSENNPRFSSETSLAPRLESF